MTAPLDAVMGRRSKTVGATIPATPATPFEKTNPIVGDSLG